MLIRSVGAVVRPRQPFPDFEPLPASAGVSRQNLRTRHNGAHSQEQ
jgi:hypothetical protein